MYKIIIACFIISACASTTKTSTTSTNKSNAAYSEDLSALRPKVELPSDSANTNTIDMLEGKRNPTIYIEPKIAINDQLDAVLDSISEINLSNNYVDGYTIQIYSGVKREEALNTKKQISTLLPDIDAEVQFVQPNFRVRSGKYLNRMDAQKDYMAVKKQFPNAIVIPERIPIK